MPAERLPAEILQFVQPGRVIDPASGAKIYDFVTESGQNMGKVVEETVTGNNGILYTIRNFITTTGAAAGTYLTTGIAAAPVELSVASGAWMAALGIGGGALLYQSMPDLFNKISDAIFGDFVDGLPVLYFDRYGRLMVDENTVNKVKNTLIDKNVYFKPQHVDLTKIGNLANYITMTYNTKSHIPSKEDVPILSNQLDILDNMTRYFTEYLAGESNIANKWLKNYAEGTLESNEKRLKLLEFLNKYYNSNYFIVLLVNSVPTQYTMTTFLVPVKIITRFQNESSTYIYPHIYYDGSYVQSVKAKVKTQLNFKKQSNSDSMFFNSMGNVANIDTFISDGSQDLIYNGNVIASYLDGQVISPLSDDPFIGTNGSFISQSDIFTDIPEDEWTYCYGHETGQGSEFFTPNLPGSNMINDTWRFDTSFIDPDGNYYVSRRPNIPANGIIVNGANGNSLNAWSTLGLEYLLSDKEIEVWVNPDATLPKEDEAVTTTYPTWPKVNAEGIGTLLQVTPQDLNPSADQEVAQSPGLDIDPNKWIEYFRNLLSEVSPDPEPAPDPSPDPAPQPQPDPDPAPTPAPAPDPDPANPNTPITPDPNPVIPPNLNTISSSRLFTVYWPTANELDLLGATLWSSNFITQMEKVWNDPMQGVISLKKVYALPQSTRSEFIILGNFDTTIMSRIVENQFVYTDCGTLQVPEVMHNATDFTPYTQIAIYLPFIGIQELDADDIIGGRLHLIYRFDLYTGVCLAELYVLRADMTPEKMLYCFTGNAAQEIPLTGSNAQGFFNTLMTIGGGAIVAASGGALTGAVGVAAIGHSMSHEMTHVGRSGNLSANAGIMGNRYPQIIISNRNRYDANGYNTIYGYPANKTVYLGNCNGFTKVKAINLHTFATQPEKDEIERLLKEGVIF